QHAVDFILEQVKARPGEIDLITLGPLTNIALAVEKDLATMKQVRSIMSMGGAAFDGNTNPVAEFNYWFDPVSVDIVYQALGESVPITMVGLDVTRPSLLDMNDLEDRKSTRLNSSHVSISYAVFCLKKKHTKRWMIWNI